MTEQSGFDVFGAKRPAEERIAHQVDLADRQVVGRAPVAVDPLKIFTRGGAHGSHTTADR